MRLHGADGKFMSGLVRNFEERFSHNISFSDPLPTDWPGPVKRKLLDNYTKLLQVGKRSNRYVCHDI